MDNRTKRLTTAAVCTALAVIMCALTVYLGFMPLCLAAFCIFIACKRSGIVYGVLCAVSSITLMFLISALSIKWLAFTLVFAPYGVLMYYVNNLSYRKPKTAIIRIAIVTLYINVTVGILYALAIGVAYVNAGTFVEFVKPLSGGYVVFALLATVILLPLDAMFSAMATLVLKKIPPLRTEKTFDNAQSNTPQDGQSPNDIPNYDIFGYEIKPKSDDDKKSNDE